MLSVILKYLILFLAKRIKNNQTEVNNDIIQEEQIYLNQINILILKLHLIYCNCKTIKQQYVIKEIIGNILIGSDYFWEKYKNVLDNEKLKIIDGKELIKIIDSDYKETKNQIIKKTEQKKYNIIEIICFYLKYLGLDTVKIIYCLLMRLMESTKKCEFDESLLTNKIIMNESVILWESIRFNSFQSSALVKSQR